MQTMDKVQLKVGGRVWQGWTATSISRSLGAVAGQYSLTLTRQFRDAKVLPLKSGMAVEVSIGQDRVLTGYISEVVPSYDAKNVSYEVIGHDKTVDLVDCSVVHGSGQWKNIGLAQLARGLCQPFGIDVVVETDLGAAFPVVRLEQGETVFELLERLTRQRGVLMTSDAYGRLVFTRASKQLLDVTLALGVNIRAARGRFSDRERHNQYIVKGSALGWSSQQVNGEQVIVNDAGVSRYRPKILLTEEVFTAEGASRRGQWQRSRAIAKSVTSEITVSGWRAGKALWPLNVLVKVTDPIQDLNQAMLLTSVTYIEDDKGRVSVLGFAPPESMDIPAQIEPVTGGAQPWG